MTTLVQSVRRSLFVRLLLIFGITVFLFFIIISVALQQLNQNSNEIEAIPDFFSRNVEDIIEDIGSPPNLQSAINLATDLEWTINIRNPIMIWSSDNDARLNVDDSVYNRTLSNGAEIRSINNEDIITVRRNGYEYYLYQRNLEGNDFDAFWIYMGIGLAAIILFLNYFMVNKLLDPVRLLKRGAERIRQGDLSFRVQSNRQDELGELTESINHMADSLQSMLEAKRQLLLAISHELKTPLTKAKLRLEFMEDSTEKEQLKEDITEIDLLISDLVEAERLNDDHSILNSEPTPMVEFVEGVAEQFQPYDSGIVIDCPEQDKTIEIDRLRFRLLLTNLVNNAIRHGRENPIRVRLGFEDEYLQLTVEDEGEGISQEHLENIAEPFYRADSSRTRNTGGFGLGLYLCRMIAQAHGGTLHIESEVGVGTKVTVKIPLQLPRLPDGSINRIADDAS